jgi:hypothetical protein
MCGEKCFCVHCQLQNYAPLAIEGVVSEEESHDLGETTQLIKLPSCGHIFNVAALDVLVTKKCLSLPAEGAVTCPVPDCNKRILDRDCWRYAQLMQQRFDRWVGRGLEICPAHAATIVQVGGERAGDMPTSCSNDCTGGWGEGWRYAQLMQQRLYRWVSAHAATIGQVGGERAGDILRSCSNDCTGGCQVMQQGLDRWVGRGKGRVITCYTEDQDNAQ